MDKIDIRNIPGMRASISYFLSKGLSGKDGKLFPTRMDDMFRIAFGFKSKFTYMGIEGKLSFIPEPILSLYDNPYFREYFRQGVEHYINKKVDDPENFRFTIKDIKEHNLEYIPLEVIKEVLEWNS